MLWCQVTLTQLQGCRASRVRGLLRGWEEARSLRSTQLDPWQDRVCRGRGALEAPLRGSASTGLSLETMPLCGGNRPPQGRENLCEPRAPVSRVTFQSGTRPTVDSSEAHPADSGWLAL